MNIPASTLESVRKLAQPNGRKKKAVPVIVKDGKDGPILDTHNGRTCAVVGKDWLCGNYYE